MAQNNEKPEVIHKDPAALIYVANFLLLTKTMRAHEIGWLTLLALHQYWSDDKSLPDDIDALGALCNVRMSEGLLFQRCWNETLERLFEKRSGRLYSNDLATVIKSRKDAENQANKNDKSGRISFFCKELRANYTQDENLILFLKKQVDFDVEVNINKKFVKETFERCYNLYKKVNTNINSNTVENTTEGVQGEAMAGQAFERYKFSFDNDYEVDQTVSAQNSFSPKDLVLAREMFWAEKKEDREMVSKPYTDLKVHFIRWCKHNEKLVKSKNPERKNEQGIGNKTRRGHDIAAIDSAADEVLQQYQNNKNIGRDTSQ